ncbi:MAG: hypothetical protein K6G36_03000, partial [Candidatus Saccharibacteria bacterium]|nr:hypothetical protein [Candidatus Saccharibacteria bacterium]
MATSLAKNDPYRKMRSGQQDTRPEFLSNQKDDRATKDLRSVENKAGDEAPRQAEDSIAGARESEENADGFYTGDGGSSGDNKIENKGGFLKRKGPIGLIMGLILGVGGMMGGAQMFQPFSLLEQFRETFNSMQTSANTRSNRLLRYQMDKGLVKYPTQVRFGKTEFSLSNKQKNKLSQGGIEYDEKMKALVYVDEDTGRTKIVAADDAAMAKIKADFEIDAKTTDVATFKVAYEDDLKFYKTYNGASLTWRGAIANWFESATLKFLIENSLTRNLFVNYRQELDESGGNVKATTVDMIAKGTENI